MCNQECSIFYEYPTQNTWKWLSKNFNITKNEQNKFILYLNYMIVSKTQLNVINLPKYLVNQLMN